MNSKVVLVLLRISMGWVMFYAGITKIMNPNWSAAGYLRNAKTFPDFFRALTDSDVLPVVNLVNEWGLALLGVALIFGVGLRLAGVLGAVLMMLYYFPVLDYPHPNPNSYIVDDHIIYALVLLFFAWSDSARAYSLRNWTVSKFPKLSWLTS